MRTCFDCQGLGNLDSNCGQIKLKMSVRHSSRANPGSIPNADRQEKKKEKNPLRFRYFLETNTGKMWEEGIGETQYQMKGVEPLYCNCEGRRNPFRVKSGSLSGKTEPFLGMEEPAYGRMEGTKPETNNVKL